MEKNVQIENCIEKQIEAIGEGREGRLNGQCREQNIKKGMFLDSDK